MKLKMFAPWKKSHDKPTKHIKKQIHYFANKDPYSQSYCFSSSHVWMWELDHNEGWALKNWCFWNLVLENTPESPSESKEIKAVNHKGNKSWIFFGKPDAEGEAPIFWQPTVKSRFIGKDPGGWERLKAGGEGDNRRRDGWMASLTQWAWVWPSFGDGEGQRRPPCCIHGVIKSWTLLSDWTTTTLSFFNDFLQFPYKSITMKIIAVFITLPYVWDFSFIGQKLRPVKNASLNISILVSSVSRSIISDSVIPWTVVCQASLSIGLSRQEYWKGLPFPSLEDLPDPGINVKSPALQVDSLPYEATIETHINITYHYFLKINICRVYSKIEKE